VNPFCNRYKTFHFTHCCPTRWLGILNTFKAVEHNWVHLVTLKKLLIEQGHGSTDHPVGTCCTAKCKKSTELRHALDCDPADVPMGVPAFCKKCWNRKPVSSPGVDTASEEEEGDAEAASSPAAKVTKVEETYPGATWTTATVAPGYAVINGMVGNETGAKLSKVSKKRCVLLDEVVGITIVNEGLMAMMLEALSGYLGFVTRLQTTIQPVQHRVRDQILSLLEDLLAWPEPGLAVSKHPGKCGHWRKMLLPKGHPGTTQHPSLHTHCLVDLNQRGRGPYQHAKLVLQVDRVAKRYTAKIRACCIKRFEPYMTVHAAMSKIDLRYDRSEDDEATAGLELVCKRHGLDAVDVTTDLNRAQRAAETSSPADKRAMKDNLYGYYFAHMAAFRANFPHLWRYVRVIFSIPFATAVVESLFSRVNANKTKTRNCLGEDTLDGGLHSHDAVSPLDNPTTPDQPLRFFTGIVKLNLARSKEHTLGSSWGL
jgi:hypothetical protein